MSTSTHPVAPEEVMAFLDGELSADRTEFVSAHIQECAECRQTADAFHSISASLGKWTAPAAPVCFKEGLLHPSSNTKTLDVLVSGLGRFLGRRSRLAWGGAVLAALLIFFGLNSARAPRMASHRPEFGQALRVLNVSPAPPNHRPVAEAEPRSADHPSAAQKGLITLASPNVAPDSNGLLRGLGEQPQNSFSLDGQPDVKIVTHAGLVPASPMIARTVSLGVVVKDFDAGRASLDAVLARHNGYAASLNVSTPEGSRRALQASLRIPAPQLGAALGELKSLGRVEGETQNGEEVTEQHSDLVARITNDRETEVRLQDILRTRTGKVKDVLDVEQEIARVRGEIEQMEAEQKILEHRVDFASIDLKLAEEYQAQLTTPAPSVLIQLRNATVDGFRNALGSLLALVLFLAGSGPTVLVWLALLGIPAWRLWRRYRRAQSFGSLAGA